MVHLGNAWPQILQSLTLLMLAWALWKCRYLLQSSLSWFLNLWLTASTRITDNNDPNHRLPSLPYIWPNGQGNLAKFIHGRENSKSWREKYGAIYQIWAGMRPEVVLTRAEDVYTVYKDSHNHTKAVDNNSGYLFGQLLGSCLGLVSGSDWRKIHTVFQPYFVQRSSHGHLRMICRRTITHISTICKRAQLAEAHQLDTIADIRMLPFSVIAEILYGALPEHLLNQLMSLIDLRERIFTYAISGGLTRFRFFSWLPLKPLRELREYERKWSAFNDAVYYHQKGNSDFESTDTPPILPLYHAMQQGKLTRTQLLQTIDEILFANIDVTMGAISWCLIFLAKFPAARDKIRQEIECHLTSTPSKLLYDLNALPSSYLTSSTTYLSAFIHESSRHRPLAAFSIPQSAPTPRTFSTSSPPTLSPPSSYTIPGKIDYIVDAHSLNIRDTAYWGTDTCIFRPERFLERWGLTNEQTSPTSSFPSTSRLNDLRYHYWRFGFGPRQCLGRFVADLMLRCLIVEITMRLDLTVEASALGETDTSEKNGNDNSSGWDRDLETWILHPVTKLECRVRNL